MRKVKWGVIGCGGIADRRTIPGMMLADNAELVAVMDTSLEVAERVKEKYGAKYAFDNFNDLLAIPEIEAVYIASPVFAHREQALASAQAGKHILIEKPIGRTLDESYEIIDAAEAAGVKLGVGLMMRYHSYHKLMKQIIEDGKIGEIVSMRAQFTCWYPRIEGAWRQNKDISGGGALMDMGIHAIDLLCYVSGLTPVDCTGYAYNQTFGYNADDSSSLIMKMNNGALAYVDSNFNIPDAAARCPIEIYGTKGSIIAVGTLGQVERGRVELICASDDEGYDAKQDRGEMRTEILTCELGNMYEKEIRAFSDAVINNTVPPTNGRNTIVSQQVIDAIYKNGGGAI